MNQLASVEPLFYHYLQVAGNDKVAAAILTLADVLNKEPPTGALVPIGPLPPQPWAYEPTHTPDNGASFVTCQNPIPNGRWPE